MDAGRDGKRDVIGVAGLGHQHFVARIEAGEEGQQDGFGSAGGDDDLVRMDVQAESGIVPRQLFPEGEEALAGTVFQGFARDGLQGVQPFLGGGQVRLPDIQVIHFHAFPLGSVGEGCEFPDG